LQLQDPDEKIGDITSARHASAANGVKKPSVVVFLPVYNEEAQISSLMGRLRPLLEANVVDGVIAVDDGSTDRTPQILSEFEFCTVIRHPSRQGCGDAIRSAYRHALQEGYDIFVIMAGNGKDDPAQIERLLQPIVNHEADYVQGSRFLAGGLSQGLPWHRKLAMRMFTWTFSLFLLRKYTDCTNGFRAYRTSVLRDERIGWAQDWLGHSYEIEFYLHYKVAALGYRVSEVPVSKIYRRAADGSYSKVRIRDWLTNLKPLFFLRFGLKK
jgi:dolichol-phosphate mannosyltransferase